MSTCPCCNSLFYFYYYLYLTFVVVCCYRWGKSQGKGYDDMGTMSIPTHLPPPPIAAEGGSRNYFGLAGGPPAPPLPGAGGPLGPGGFMSLPPALPMAPAGALSYPSQDPSRMGAVQGNF